LDAALLSTIALRQAEAIERAKLAGEPTPEVEFPTI
jgi:hypothetical protein